MLKHAFRSLVLTLCLGLATGVAMADLPAPVKIGVLDWQQLLSKAPQAEAAGKRLEKKFEKPKNEFISKQKGYQSKREMWERDKDTMASAERAKKEKEVAKMEQELRRMNEELQSDYAAAQREEMDEFLKTVKEVVDKFAKEANYDLVLPQETTVYVSPQIDLTAKILELLEKNYKKS